ncbi:MAG: trimeric intracellular cation channel family protein [Clostridia bacterium]|nr:trimeric intracellular cation channel family protein [Clostridia bacterium]
MGIFSTIIEIIGVIAFSISGAMIAIRRRTDLFGVILLSIITAHGGGLTRDVIFSFSPPAIFSLKWYILICVIVAIIVFLFARKFSHTYLENELRIEKINDIFDALGLGIFAVVGVMVAIDKGYSDNALICITCGLLTGICGGMLRDVLTNNTPFVLVKRIYAIAALLGASVYYILYMYGSTIHINETLAIIFGVAVTFILRILAMTFKWNMPIAIK